MLYASSLTQISLYCFNQVILTRISVHANMINITFPSELSDSSSMDAQLMFWLWKQSCLLQSQSQKSAQILVYNDVSCKKYYLMKYLEYIINMLADWADRFLGRNVLWRHVSHGAVREENLMTYCQTEAKINLKHDWNSSFMPFCSPTKHSHLKPHSCSINAAIKHVKYCLASHLTRIQTTNIS